MSVPRYQSLSSLLTPDTTDHQADGSQVDVPSAKALLSVRGSRGPTPAHASFMSAVEAIQLPVSQRAEWHGFQPLKPVPLPEQVVSIDCNQQDDELLAYFYAAVAAQERSQRVLDVTMEVSCDMCLLAGMHTCATAPPAPTAR